MKPELQVTQKVPSILESTAVVAAGSVLSTAAFVAVLRLFAGLGNVWLEAGLAVAFYLLLFLALLGFMERYSRSDWTVPKGSEQSNWALRNRVSLGLGMLAVAVTAAVASVRIDDGLARGLHCLIAVIMAVSGANDIRRFRLPLPLTICGFAASAVLFAIGPYSWLILVLALVWAVVLVLIHTFVARSGMALGDILVLFWIALSSPFNGLLAVFVAQLTMDVLARITTWKANKTRIPIGGAWLIATAAVLALQQWPAMLSATTANAPVLARVGLTTGAQALPGAKFKAGAYSESGVRDLKLIVRDAAYLTALLSMEDDRDKRIAASLATADRVSQMRVYALQTEVPKQVKLPVAEVLADLALALGSYDTDGVRGASARLAEQRVHVDALYDDYMAWKELTEVASTNSVGGTKP
jgi:hypothetical protein